jgi:hypothetical protein
VPPPPAPGGLLGVTVGLALEVAVGCCVAVLEPVAPADELAPVLAAPLVAALPEAEPLAEPLPEPLPEPVDVGAGWVPGGGVDEDEAPDGEHPATATARMAKTPKPLTASFTLSTVPAMVTRTAM